MTYEELIVSIRARLRNTDMTDSQITELLMETEAVIKNYCCIAEIPVGLKYTWCNMTIDLISYIEEKNRVSASIEELISSGQVSQVTIGDTSIKLGGDGMRNKALDSHQPKLDSVILNYRQQLNLYRRIW